MNAPLIHHTLIGIGRRGVPTVLLHGAGDDLGVWSPLTSELTLAGPIVSYDLRGHGRSTGTAGAGRADDLVGDHLGVLADLGIPRANLVAVASGAAVALAVALQAPETVQRLVMIAPELGSGAGAAAPAIAPDGLAGLRDRLGDVKASTLVIAGENDARRDAIDAITTGLGDGRGELIAGAQDRLLEQEPAAVADLVGAFLTAATIDVAQGMTVRREVLGDLYVDRALAHEDPISTEFQEFLTSWCWGEVWTDDRLARRERSLLVLGMTAALGRMKEFESHTRGAIRNGVTEPELASVLRQISVYCGIPAGVNAAAAMRDGIASVAQAAAADH